MDRSKSGKSQSGPQPSNPQTFVSDPAVDRLTTTELRLTEDVGVLTARLAMAEALARRRGALEEGKIDNVPFSSAEDEKNPRGERSFYSSRSGPP